MIKKRNNWRFLWILPILILTITAVPKLIGMEFMVQNMGEAGMGHMTFGVGLIEILCVIVFLIPSTRNLGFLLLVAYSGGIIATEWAAHKPVIPGILVQVLLWIGMYFENPTFFTLAEKA